MVGSAGLHTIQTWAKYCPAELGLGLSEARPCPGCPCRPLPSGYRPQCNRSRHGAHRCWWEPEWGGGDARSVSSSSALPTPPSSEAPRATGDPFCEVSVPDSVCPVGLDSGDIPALSPPRWAWESGIRCCALLPSPETKCLQHFVTTLPHQGAWAPPAGRG